MLYLYTRSIYWHHHQKHAAFSSTISTLNIDQGKLWVSFAWLLYNSYCPPHPFPPTTQDIATNVSYCITPLCFPMASPCRLSTGNCDIRWPWRKWKWHIYIFHSKHPNEFLTIAYLSNAFWSFCIAQSSSTEIFLQKCHISLPHFVGTSQQKNICSQQKFLQNVTTKLTITWFPINFYF